MQNEFLSEETPQYKAPAPLAQQTAIATETEMMAENPLTIAELPARFKAMKLASWGRVTAFTVGMILFAVVPVLLAAWSAAPTSGGALSLLVASILGVCAGLTALLQFRKRGKPLHDYERLARMGGAASVGPLLDLWQANLTHQNGLAIDAALVVGLSQMKAEDAPLLAPAQRSLLLSYLRMNPRFGLRTDFCVAALKALEQIGVASDIPLVERIARMTPRNPNTLRIRDAAEECLPLLRIRAGLTADSKTLLRASAPEKAGRDTLLRAASGAMDKAPNELLRPSDSSD